MVETDQAQRQELKVEFVTKMSENPLQDSPEMFKVRTVLRNLRKRPGCEPGAFEGRAKVMGSPVLEIILTGTTRLYQHHPLFLLPTSPVRCLRAPDRISMAEARQSLFLADLANALGCSTATPDEPTQPGGFLNLAEMTEQTSQPKLTRVVSRHMDGKALDKIDELLTSCIPKTGLGAVKSPSMGWAACT